jgi:hypothetical protein
MSRMRSNLAIQSRGQLNRYFHLLMAEAAGADGMDDDLRPALRSSPRRGFPTIANRDAAMERRALPRPANPRLSRRNRKRRVPTYRTGGSGCDQREDGDGRYLTRNRCNITGITAGVRRSEAAGRNTNASSYVGSPIYSVSLPHPSDALLVEASVSSSIGRAFHRNRSQYRWWCSFHRYRRASTFVPRLGFIHFNHVLAHPPDGDHLSKERLRRYIGAAWMDRLRALVGFAKRRSQLANSHRYGHRHSGRRLVCDADIARLSELSFCEFRFSRRYH